MQPMDVRLVNPLLSALKTVFKDKLSTDLVFNRPVKKATQEHTADVCVLISLSGDATGSVTFCFPMRTAVSIASQFHGQPVTREQPEFADSLGELARLIAGSAGDQLQGLKVGISPPNVVVGRSLCIQGTGTVSALALPCESAFGPFWAEATMTQRGAREPAPTA